MELATSLIADGLVIVIFLIAMITFATQIPRSKWWYWGWRIVVVGLLTYALAQGIAAVYQPVDLRPFELQGVEPGASYLNNPGFPSDHALFATFLTVSVWVTTRKRGLTMALAVMTIIMSIGRVLALVHTPLDVIGGVAIGATALLWYRLLTKK